jgi:hypothetical protein
MPMLVATMTNDAMAAADITVVRSETEASFFNGISLGNGEQV